MIKILHSSDWHLGKSLFAKSLLDDQRVALDELSAMIAEEKPELVILAGDLFDRSVPPEDAVKLLDQFLAKAVIELKVPVAMIPGNHDSSTRIGVGAELLRASGLHVFSTPESIATPLKIDAGGVKASIYGIPYLEPNEWSFHFNSGAENPTPLRTHEEALKAILESLKPSLEKDRLEGRRTVLILHAYVTGGEASESERPLSIGGSDLVPAELLVDFDYVALGHLHRPQKVSSERIRYPGSLFCYSQSEADQLKGAVIIKLEAKASDDTFTFREFKTTRKLIVVRGTLEELIETAKTVTSERTSNTSAKASVGTSAAAAKDVVALADAHDYVVAVLTDQSLPFEAFRRLNAVYPGLLHVARDVNWSRSSAEEADHAARTMKREVSDRDVLAQFISTAASGEISNEDREWLLSQLEAFTASEEESAT